MGKKLPSCVTFNHLITKLRKRGDFVCVCVGTEREGDLQYYLDSILLDSCYDRRTKNI